MKVVEFITGIPEAVTPGALSRAVDAAAMLPRWRRPMESPAWEEASRLAKAAVLADADLSRPGVSRDQAWAAVAVAMDAAGALAIPDFFDQDKFQALTAPWTHMTGQEL